MMETVKEETGRQTVILIFTLVGTVATVLLVRSLDEPDFIRTTKMRGALAVQRVCRQGALALLTIGDKAESLYDKERA